MNRRSLLLGVGAALAAPAIVKAESLMKIAQLRGTLRPNVMVVNWADGEVTLVYQDLGYWGRKIFEISKGVWRVPMGELTGEGMMDSA